MSLLQSVRNIRILPTARAIKRLENAGVVLISNDARLQARGRLGAGRRVSRIIRAIAKPEIIRALDLNNAAVNLDVIDIDNIQAGFGKNAILSRTRWLMEKVKAAGSSKFLNRILEETGISRDGIEASIAKELRESVAGLALITVDLNSRESEALVQQKAASFLALANLSRRGDAEFVNFVINVLIKASLQHQPSSPVHYGAVTFYAAAIAIELGIAGQRAFQRLKTAALLHDVGKIAIPLEYLTKRRPEVREFKYIKEHLPLSVYLLRGIKWLRNVVPIVQHHHDNGRGYPAWLSRWDKEPDQLTRMVVNILKVADAFDGMTSKREYKGEGDKYVHERDGKVFVQKIYRQEEAIEYLLKDGWNAEVLGALKRVLRRGRKYIYEIDKYFERSELKLAWFGIEHLIKKTILPFEGRSLDLVKDELILMDHRALLWLMSGRELDHEDATNFIRIIRSELRAGVENNGLHKQYGRIFALEFDLRLRGLLYIVLYRALKVDEKEGSNTFFKLMRLSIHLLGDPLALERMIRSFRLDNESYSDAKFEWISLKLYGEDANPVPVLGRQAFIANVDRCFSMAGPPNVQSF